MEVRSVQNIDLSIIKDQTEAVFDDIRVDAVKIGMLSSPDTVEVVANSLNKYKPEFIVLDPVMVSKGGHHLLQEEAITALKKQMIPFATVITPNIPEAEVLTGIPIHSTEDQMEVCRAIHALGAKTVLLKGGHLSGDPIDLFFDGSEFHWINGERIHTKNTHGTGCTFSSAIAANLAKGASLKTAIEVSKSYISLAIKHSFNLGHGYGPTNHFYELYEKANLIKI